MGITRRNLGASILSVSAASTFAHGARAAGEQPSHGGTLRWAYYPEPSAIIAINTSSGTGSSIGTKINEGHLTYDCNMTPCPVLATNWTVSPDGLR